MRLCCLMLLLVTIGNAEAQTRWKHNGSVMTLYADGPYREFKYETPRAGLPSIVTTGAILFIGERKGNLYSGQAFTFSSACGARRFQVSGPVSQDQRTVTLRGSKPVLNEKCRVVGHQQETLVFSLIESDSKS